MPSLAAFPANRYGTPEEFATMCAVLCGDAARYVVGENVSVDGGLVRSMV
jgi:3-oxoacyl-[acyl-carrier protein] reductase